MTQDPMAMAVIAAQLRQLVESSPETEAGIEAWNTHAYNVYCEVRCRFPHLPLPPAVLRYVHDADIRVRDPEFAAAQTARMEAVIRDLEGGIVPRSEDVSIELPGGLTLSINAMFLLFLAGLALVVVGAVLIVRGGK